MAVAAISGAIAVAALVAFALYTPMGRDLAGRAGIMTGGRTGQPAAMTTPVGQRDAAEAALEPGTMPEVTLEDQAGREASLSSGEVGKKAARGTTVVVGPRDTVARIAARHYGRIDANILELVRQANTHLGSIDLIYEGQKIYLPPLAGGPQAMFTVSVATYHSINEATAVFLDLVKKGFKATVYPFLDANGNTWYRVTIGTFPSLDEADAYAGQLKGRGFLYARSVKVSVEG